MKYLECLADIDAFARELKGLLSDRDKLKSLTESCQNMVGIWEESSRDGWIEAPKDLVEAITVITRKIAN